MGYISTIICLFIGILAFKKDKRLYSPLGLFASFWALLLFLSLFRFYGLFSTSPQAYSVVLLGVVCYGAGCLVVNGKGAVRYDNKQNLSNKAYNIALFVCLVSLVLNFQIIAKTALSGFNVSQLYYMMANTVSGEETELSSLYNTNLVRLQQFVGYPLLYLLVPISIVEFLETKKKKYLYVGIGLSLLRFLVDIRRTYLVIIAVFVFFLILIRRKELWDKKIQMPKMSKGRKILLYIGCIVLAYGFASLSSARRGGEGEEYSLASNFYYYYVGSLPYLGQRLEALSNIDYTFGFTSFRGFWAPIFSTLGLIGFNEPHAMTVATTNVNDLHNVVMLITQTHNFNSYATCFFEFFLDGGYIGVAIISFLFGYYSQQLFRKTVTYKTNRYMWKFAFFLSLFIYLSVLHFNGVVVCYIWPFIIERWLYSNKQSA